MGDGEQPDGAARLELASGVRLLHPEDAVLQAMLSGWAKQQLGGRRLDPKTVASRERTINAFVAFSNEYPWRWTAALVDEWTTHLVTERRLARSTIRSYQVALRLFCDYLVSPYYGWAQECLDRFGTHPTQVCHEWNTAAHLVEYEGRPGRRPLTRDEVQRLFDYADARVEQAVRLGRKGALAAYRDATVLKTIYGWGLRCTEVSRLDLADFYRNPQAPALGRFGLVHVRWGKATRGSGPRRRMVASLMPWAVEALEDYVVNIRPRFGLSQHPGVWVTERGGRLKPREIEERFGAYRDALGMDGDLSPHCLRHSYITHSIEDGVDPKFVQDQVGHLYASTLGIYTHISPAAMNTMMDAALEQAFTVDGERQ
ncbi:tyrosine-type recombinase/integrase [Actinoplanes sp. NPDC049802]|uniref:tyrosine-type recombinase/integrase n=1 Tax=Actinoplanes sp. NPDC049802 TaxID=3154742 RepID=UPI0033FA6F92